MRMSIRLKLILSIGIPILVIYLAVIALDYSQSKRARLRQARRGLEQHVSAKGERVGTVLRSARDAAGQLADVVRGNPDMSDGSYWYYIRKTLTRQDDLVAVCVALPRDFLGEGTGDFAPCMYAAQGKKRLPGGGQELRTVYHRDQKGAYQDEDWYRLPQMMGEGLWTEPLRSHDQWVCRYSTPILGEGEEFFGVVAVEVGTKHLASLLRSNQPSEEHSALLSAEGRFLVHPDDAVRPETSYIGRSRQEGYADWARLGRRMQDGETDVIRLQWRGAAYWVAFAPVPDSDWSMATWTAEETLLQPVYQTLRAELLVLLAALALLEGIVLITGVALTRPIKKLSRAVRELTGGNLRAKVTGAESQDEIGDFARAFNDMVDHLNEHVRKLTEETAARQAVEGELQVARTIQKSLLPREEPMPTRRDEFSLYAVNRPARRVAGDFYDYFETDDPDVLGFVIADVSGKGVPAALFMAVSRTIVRNLARTGELSPAEVLNRANATLEEENHRNMFVTMFLGYYHLHTGRIRYANAGHNHPYILGSSGRLRKIEPSTGPMLGVFAEQTFGDDVTTLHAGETLVLYTDGVTDATDTQGRAFGIDRLESLLPHLAREKRVCDVAERIVQAVDAFEGDKHFDDVTIMTLRRL